MKKGLTFRDVAQSAGDFFGHSTPGFNGGACARDLDGSLPFDFYDNLDEEESGAARGPEIHIDFSARSSKTIIVHDEEDDDPVPEK